jgi:hypothetical protein
MAFMAKLKDEVTALRQALKAKECELAAASETSVQLRADLAEAATRVSEQQEKLESLADQLELVQHRTPQAQLISMHMAGPSRSISHLTDMSLQTQGGRLLLPASSGGGLQALLGGEGAAAAGSPLDELQQQLAAMWQKLNVSWLHRCGGRLPRRRLATPPPSRISCSSRP